MATSDQLKQQIDAQITNKTANKSITPPDVGNNMKAIVDFVNQQDALVIAPVVKVMKVAVSVAQLYALKTTPIVLLTNTGSTTYKFPIGYYMIRQFGEFYNAFGPVYVAPKYGATIETVNQINTAPFEDETSGFSQGIFGGAYTNYPNNAALFPDSYVLYSATNFTNGDGGMLLYLLYAEIPL